MAMSALKFETSIPVAAPAGPAIDLVHLSRQTMGDEALETELLGLFAKQAALVTARLAQDSAAVELCRADLAHTLKGSARSVGAHRVAAAAEAYETAAREGGHPDLATLEGAVAEACAVIADLVGA
jgi:HPt (histidine-containing phosphotransfer) domain-containing protein